MANITQWLKKIKSAIFGKDVRSAIYNSIDLINKEIITNTSKQNSLETKFDNQIKNMTLSSPSDAEIVDARTSDTGITYNTLGARLSAERVDGTVNLLRSTGLVKNRDYNNIWSISTAVWNISDNTDGTTPHGNRSFRGDCDDNTAYYGIHQGVSLKSNTTYTMSMWILFDSTCADDEGVVMQASCKLADGTIDYLTAPVRAKNVTKGEWNHVTFTFTTKDLLANAKHDICVQTDKRLFHGYVGDEKLELGKHNTDWSPSPLDLVYQASVYTDEQYAKAIAYTNEVTEKAYINGKIDTDFDLAAGTYYTFENLATYQNKNITSSLQCSLAGIYNISSHISLYNRSASNEECLLEVKVLVNDTEASSTTHYVIFGPLTHANVLVSTLANVTSGDSIKIRVTNKEDSRGYTLDATQSYVNINKI
ncbi:MAG: hypothetical protein ACI4WU_04720 [Bacilli bacterium]